LGRRSIARYGHDPKPQQYAIDEDHRADNGDRLKLKVSETGAPFCHRLYRAVAVVQLQDGVLAAAGIAKIRSWRHGATTLLRLRCYR